MLHLFMCLCIWYNLHQERKALFILNNAFGTIYTRRGNLSLSLMSEPAVHMYGHSRIGKLNSTRIKNTVDVVDLSALKITNIKLSSKNLHISYRCPPGY